VLIDLYDYVMTKSHSSYVQKLLVKLQATAVGSRKGGRQDNKKLTRQSFKLRRKNGFLHKHTGFLWRNDFAMGRPRKRFQRIYRGEFKRPFSVFFAGRNFGTYMFLFLDRDGT